MKPTEILMEEHQLILRVLEATEKNLAFLREGKGNLLFFLDLADFIVNFTDKCHHAKEEGILFKQMEAGGIPVEGGPIGVLLADHEQGRRYTLQMKAAVEKWQAGDVDAAKTVLVNGQRYVNLLRGHIQKENDVLFPMADKIIPAEHLSEMEEEFERVEKEETGAGVHEKYEALAEKLIRGIHE